MGTEIESTASSKQARQAIIAIVVLVVVLVAAFAGYQLVSANAAPKAEAYELSSGQDTGFPAAEAVAACEIANENNELLELRKLVEGKPAVVNVWASWCSYCVDELADYQRLYEEYGDRVEFVFVDAVQGDMREFFLARDFLSEGNYAIPAYYDTKNNVMSLFSIRGLPTSIVLSADGSVLMNRPGIITYENMKATIDALLAE